MLIDYFTCIALKIVVLEMIALIKKWTIKSLGIRNFIKINQVLVLPITMTPGDIRLGKKMKVSWKQAIVWIGLLSFGGK